MQLFHFFFFFKATGSSPGLRFISFCLQRAPARFAPTTDCRGAGFARSSRAFQPADFRGERDRKKRLTIRQPTWLATRAAAGAALSGINHHPIFSSPPSEQQNERASLAQLTPAPSWPSPPPPPSHGRNIKALAWPRPLIPFSRQRSEVSNRLCAAAERENLKPQPPV